MQSSGSLPKHTATISVEKFMGYMEKSIYGLMQTRFYYELIWLQIGFAQQLSVESPTSNFDKIWKDLQNIGKSLLTVISKLASLLVNSTENQNYLIMFDGTLPCKI
jgi:hypothetical protein